MRIQIKKKLYANKEFRLVMPSLNENKQHNYFIISHNVTFFIGLDKNFPNIDDSSYFNLNSHCLKEINDLNIGFECGSFEPSIENVDLFNLGWIWF